jgi:predicted NBD/HSP70 family sugar kinase
MGEKADSELVRRQNRRIVLESLRRHGPMARIELGRLTGLSPASITSISAQLIGDNAILELDDRISLSSHVRRGRPVVRLALKPSATHVAAIKISADELQIVLADFSGKEVAQKTLPLPTFTAKQDAFGNLVAKELKTFLDAAGLKPSQIARIGIAAQGNADSRDGRIAWSPVFAARDIPITKPIEDTLGIPCMLANDANMIAEGLAAKDPARYGGVTAVVFTGYGVGMGLIIDGKVFHGATGAASELGHMNHIPHGALCRCGRGGCLEAYVADYAILRMAEEAGESDIAAVPPEKMQALLERAQGGDAAAQAAYAKAGDALGFGIARLIALLNPDRVVIAGPGLTASQFVEPAMQKAIADGVVEELRRNVAIEYISFSTDMIISGTVTALLRVLDRDVFAAGPIMQHVMLREAGE